MWVARKYTLAVAQLDLDAARNSCAQHGKLEVLLETAGQVQRNDVNVQAVACLLEGSLVGWSCSNEIILLLQLWDAEVGGAVGQENIASSQYAQTLGNGTRQWAWYWRSLGAVISTCCSLRAPGKAQDGLREGARRAQGKFKMGSGTVRPLDRGGVLQTGTVKQYFTYQLARQLSAISMCEGNHVVSYYTSQSQPLAARAPSLRTFVQESNCALQFSDSVSTSARPGYIQIVEHGENGRFCACQCSQQKW